ncbi:MAG: [Ni,Fe] uptake hydrogenase, cytochrome b subunit [Brockia lithotrophica]|uniref:[Ni,Fe] uptake hydrogenase, cytochrome b subunit n=1 Tax=Brockia lithotrophica TaxID=933949 RepID=A0A2T5G8C8_9BACL|nr:Ni/Fe-hydrogenase, b-type cytochrome subunit [Brockia lithotrophica]PTQ52423.1 MAG: [Ni,Fe] uptake hydrogenase, cytochrome b subunit [Brockia lithotrophica]
MAQTTGGSGSAQVAAPEGKLVDRVPKVERLSPGTVKVYVWELPVRVWHWINALAIFTLFVTGVYIGNPFVQPIPIEATEASNFFMGWARDIHFITGFIFTLGWIGRLYWLIWGNRYAAEHPFRKDFWKGMWETLKFYLFLPNRKQHYVGHNPLAMFSYWILGLMSLIMVVTGFYMLFEPQLESFWGKLFAWVPWIFGPSFMVRSWHRIVAWLIMIFVVVHVYMAIRDDLLEKSGTLSSIFTGYKVAPEEAVREEFAKKSD